MKVKIEIEKIKLISIINYLESINIDIDDITTELSDLINKNREKESYKNILHKLIEIEHTADVTLNGFCSFLKKQINEQC